jgi:hypothetical protein
MRPRPHRKTSGLLATLAVLGLPGCITIQAIEPVISPPPSFKGNVSVAMEFAQPGTIGFRCAERGAKFFGLPGINSGACADSKLVTMIDPCSTVTAGPYARILCDSLKLHRQETKIAAGIASGKAPASPAGLTRIGFTQGTRTPAARTPSPTPAWEAVRVEFVAADTVEMRCAERGAKMHEGGDGFLSCGDRLLITISNPCDLEETGWYPRTLCHEMAHVNGWPSDHPTRGPLARIMLASESPQALALAALRTAPASPTQITTAQAAEHDEHASSAPVTPVDLADIDAPTAGDDHKALQDRMKTLGPVPRIAAEPPWIRASGLLAALNLDRSAPQPGPAAPRSLARHASLTALFQTLHKAKAPG